MKRLLLIPVLLCALLLGGCKTLEKGGAYAPIDQVADKPLYTADAAYKMSYIVLDAAFLFERNNRQTLWAISPEIKHAVDDIRTKALQLQKDWAVARMAYVNNPTPSGMDTIKYLLAKMQQLSTVAATVITRYQNP